MKSKPVKRTLAVWFMTVVAILFGLMTIKSGGAVLFVGGEFRQQAGDYVPFVVGFNFIAGFAYVIAGIGLWKQQQWAVWAAISIAVATLVTFVLFAVHIINGGLYEQRTVIAMSIRSLVWVLIGYFAYKAAQSGQK